MCIRDRQYQLIKKISKEDPRIDGSDLPPAIINLTDTCGTFAFDYQSIYSPSGLNPDYTGVMGLNNFDDSWGIWGHNLRKVLGDKMCIRDRFVQATMVNVPIRTYIKLLIFIIILKFNNCSSSFSQLKPRFMPSISEPLLLTNHKNI